MINLTVLLYVCPKRLVCIGPVFFVGCKTNFFFPLNLGAIVSKKTLPALKWVNAYIVFADRHIHYFEKNEEEKEMERQYVGSYDGYSGYGYHHGHGYHHGYGGYYPGYGGY